MECTIISPLQILSFQPLQLLHTSFRQLFFQISDLPRQGFGHLGRMNLGRGPWLSQFVSLARRELPALGIFRSRISTLFHLCWSVL